MTTYDILNIARVNIEGEIEKAINETAKELIDLTRYHTCRLYSEVLTFNLNKRHIINTQVDTKELGYLYSHEFNLVPISSEECFLIDLTYCQFQNKYFEELLKKGYMRVDEDTFKSYIRTVCGTERNISLKGTIMRREKIKQKLL